MNSATLRLIHDSARLSSADGLAQDEALAVSVGRGEAPATLHLYEYHPAVIVGRYQNLTDAVDLDKCARRGHEWNRRHTGGGTVLMGPGQLAIGLALPEPEASVGSVQKHFKFFSRVLADALAEHGVAAELAGKNDLSIGGRKVAGLAISQDVTGCAFLHCSLLLNFDVNLMVDLLNLATRDLDDRGQSCFAQRMTTIRENNEHVSFAQMQQSILRAVEKHLETTAEPGCWTTAEQDLIDELKRTRYENDDWIYSSRVMRRWSGSAERKTPGGTLRVYVDRTGQTLDAVLITGDYFTRVFDMARLESALRFIPAEKERIRQVLEQHACGHIYRTHVDELTELIFSAASADRSRRVIAGRA